MADTPLPIPHCPRCGYDQSGAAATWTDSCPLRGTCPECGLEFLWIDAYFPERRVVPWLHEHAAGRRPAPIRGLHTLIRLWWPWSFWRKVRLEHRINLPRLFAWTLGVLIFGHVIGGMCEALTDEVYADRGYGSRRIADLLHSITQANWLTAYRNARELFIPYFDNLEPVLALLAAYFVVPFCFVLVPTTLRKANVRKAHLVRITCYSIGLFVNMAVLARAMLVARDWYEHQFGYRWTFSTPYSTTSSRFSFSEILMDVIVDQIQLRTFLIITPIMLAVFWWLALTRYLKLPHARTTALVMVTIAMLLVALIIALGGHTWFPWFF